MSKLYAQCAVSDLRPGMVLSDDVQDNHGAVLLAAGTALSVPMIASLARHQIHTVAVMHEPPETAHPSAEGEANEHTVMAGRLAHLFRRHDPDNDMDWATGVLWRYLEDFRTERSPEA